MMERPGEFMDICWGDDDPAAYYVRGHMAPEAAAALILRHKGHACVFEPPVAGWARYVPRGERFLMVDCQSGRGAFAVMRADVVALRRRVETP